MSFLDRVTKAVGDAVDRGKKEVDQFIRIQKINSAIGESERKIAQSRADIQQVKAEIGDHVLAMMRAGTFAAAELRPMADKIGTSEQQIEAEEALIAEKKAEIEKIKAEENKPHVEPPPPMSSDDEPSPPAETGVEPPMPPTGTVIAPPPVISAPEPPLPPLTASPAAKQVVPPPLPGDNPPVPDVKGSGAATVRVCPHCGAAAPTGTSFCTECGGKLTP